MKITLAKTAGFCFGVNRAVQMVYDLVEEGQKVCSLGPIIHNSQMVEELASKGVKIVNSPEEADKDGILVIRSHGVDLDTYLRAEQSGVKVADATCPFVAKIHKIVYDYIAHSPTNHDFLKSDFLDSDSPGINYNEFTETTCFYPDEAFDMGKQITRICRRYKTR